MENGKELLFPVDFSEKCIHAAASATAMAARLGARVTLLHVLSWPRLLNATGDFFGAAESATFALPIDVQAIRADRERMLAEFARREFGGMAVEQVVQSGDPAANIAEYSDQHRVAMVMMPTRGAGRFRRFLLGSVTAKVLHDVSCPVWTDAHTEEPARHAGNPVLNILCAIEIEKRRIEVLKWASSFAQTVGAGLSVVHVVPAPEAYAPAQDPTFGAFLKDTAEKQMVELLGEAGVPAQVLIEGGKIAPAIRRVAEASRADLVVIGRGCLPNTLGRLRTHAYGIIRESPCPVISV